MTPAFWDTSGLVPLCVDQESSTDTLQLLNHYSIVVWWATAVEVRSSLERLRRMGQLTASGYGAAEIVFSDLRSGWREMRPSEEVRNEAERLLGRYTLKAADSLQLAAAWVWANGLPQARTFISGDGQLLQAARLVGFQVEAV